MMLYRKSRNRLLPSIAGIEALPLASLRGYDAVLINQGG
jgi:hypothetical protein